MKKILSIILLLVTGTSVFAYNKRDILQKTFDSTYIRTSIIKDQKWVPYPNYSDRDGWDSYTGNLKAEMIANGEKMLQYPWNVIKATDYMEFDRSGNRKIMENPYEENRTAFYSLVLAELAEGKGRFMDQIVNGIWYYCEMTSWSVSAHMHHHSRAERISLPDFKEYVIELYSGDTGNMLAWTYYFLNGKLNEINPQISERLYKNLKERILDVYLTRNDFPWQAFDATPTTKVINWTPWCSFNVVNCFLLLENDPDRLYTALHRSMISVDNFMNVYNDDGACEEGPSYWDHAIGKLYDYFKVLEYAGLDMTPLYKHSLIRNMGEFISKAYIGDGWVVNYSDASARFSGPIGSIYRYGESIGSDEMKQFAAHQYQRAGSNNYLFSRDMFRNLENIKSHERIVNEKPKVSFSELAWYPQTGFLYLRDKSGFFFSAVGGTNQQGHNHNDVGSFVLFYNNKPVFIDIGVGTYTRQTFDGDRYSIWSMQSNYHNLPLINGIAQRSLGGDKMPDDYNYAAKDVKFDEKNLRLSMDISGAYHPDSKANNWYRSYRLIPGKGINIEDKFSLKEAKQANQLNFMTQAKPDISKPGVVLLSIGSESVQMQYNASLFVAEVETIPLTDTKLSNVWGNTVYRLSLNATTTEKAGKYSVNVALSQK